MFKPEQNFSAGMEKEADAQESLVEAFNNNREEFLQEKKAFRFGGEVKARAGKVLPFEKSDSGNLYGVEADGKVLAFPPFGIQSADVMYGRLNEVFLVNQEAVFKRGANFFIKEPKVVKPAVFREQGGQFVLEQPGELDIDRELKEEGAPSKDSAVSQEEPEKEKNEEKEQEPEASEQKPTLLTEWLNYAQKDQSSMARVRFMADKAGTAEQKDLKELASYLDKQEAENKS